MSSVVMSLKRVYWFMLYMLKQIKTYSLVIAFHPLKLKKKVVFICFGGKGYGCNPKYIAEEMLGQDTQYDLVWLLIDTNVVVPDRIRKVQYDSWHALYELATAKVIVINTKVDMRIIKKKGQYVIQTWHGAYRTKLVEKFAEDKLPKRYIRQSKRNSKQTDLFVSNSKILSQEYRDAFWCECEILECGLPRCDVLFHWDPKIPSIIRERFGIPENGKIVLYAPTFRDNGSTEAYNLDYQSILDALKHTGDEWYLLIRMHPNVRELQSMFTYSEHVLNATYYPDMQELLVASNILITDYSSSIYDFAVLRKPSYLYAPDVEEYRAMRGLKEQFFHLPFARSTTNEELVRQLAEYTQEYGVKVAQDFLDFYGSVDKGDAAKMVVERIKQVVEL